MKTAKWLLIIFGLLAAGVLLAGAGIIAWVWHSFNNINFK